MIRLVALLLATGLAQAAAIPDRVDLKVSKGSVLDLLIQIAEQTKAGLAIEAGNDAALAKPVTLVAAATPWADVVAFLATQGIDLRLIDDQLVVGDVDAAFRSTLVRRVHDVRVLLTGLTRFPGPDLSQPGSGGSRGLLPPIADDTPPVLNEFIEILKCEIAPRLWTRGASIAEWQGHLVVIAPPDVQAQVAARMADLERRRSRVIVMRVFAVPRAAIDQGAVVDATAAAALLAKAGAPVAAQVFADGQHGHAAQLVQRVHLSADAQPSIGATGLAIDATPQATIDGVLATVLISATTGQTWSDAAIADAAGAPLHTVQLPATRLARHGDTRLIPAGGAALYPAGDGAYAVTFTVVEPPTAPPSRP